MAEPQKKEENKKKHNITVTPVGIAYPNGLVSDLNSVSGSIYNAFNQLRSTFNGEQKTIAQSNNLFSNIETMLPLVKQVSENTDKAVKLAEQQRDDAKAEAVQSEKKRTNELYINTTISILSLVVAIVAIVVGYLFR